MYDNPLKFHEGPGIRVVESPNKREVTISATSPENYSTAEQWTGRYWIDGKKVYRKTILLGALTGGTVKSVPHNIANLKVAVLFRGVAVENDGIHVSLPCAAPQEQTNILITYDIVNVSATLGALFTGNKAMNYSHVVMDYICNDR